VLLLQILILIIAYLVIMLRKYRKLKKKMEYYKGQEEAQDLLNSFLVGSGKA
jgi:heme/copper-type cytochrome/quinol oxidase subunit 2